MIHSFQMLVTVTKNSITDFMIFEFQPLYRATKLYDLVLYIYLKLVYIVLHSKTAKLVSPKLLN